LKNCGFFNAKDAIDAIFLDRMNRIDGICNHEGREEHEEERKEKSVCGLRLKLGNFCFIF